MLKYLSKSKLLRTIFLFCLFHLQLETSCENILQALSALYRIPPLTAPSTCIQDSLNRVSASLETSVNDIKSSTLQLSSKRKRTYSEDGEKSDIQDEEVK